MNLFKKLFGKKDEEGSWADPISSAEFKNLLTKHFAPRIRELGWTGSGYHYLNFNNPPYIYVLGFQPNRHGKEAYIEIGVHFDFIPIKGLPNFNKLEPSYLKIRQKLTPNNDEYWWRYGNTKKKNQELIDSIWKKFKSDGIDYFRFFKSFPGVFESIRISDLEEKEFDFIKGIKMPTNIGSALLLARINKEIGKKEKAKEFANYGLSKIDGPNGAALIPEFEKIKNDFS
jgi:hypothetical protein